MSKDIVHKFYPTLMKNSLFVWTRAITHYTFLQFAELKPQKHFSLQGGVGVSTTHFHFKYSCLTANSTIVLMSISIHEGFHQGINIAVTYSCTTTSLFYQFYKESFFDEAWFDWLANPRQGCSTRIILNIDGGNIIQH